MKIKYLLLAAVLLLGTACVQEKSPLQAELEAARNAYASGLYLDAETRYERYLQLAPQGENRREAWDRLLEIARTIKDDKERTVTLLEAMFLERSADKEEAWSIMYNLGEAYDGLRNYNKALESFERCLIIAQGKPKMLVRTYQRMARVHGRRGNFDLVTDALLACSKVAPDDLSKAQCLYDLAQSYSLANDWSGVKNTLNSLLALKNTNPEIQALAKFLLAEAYESDRNYAKARELLTSILDTYPNPKVVEARLAKMPR